MQYTTSAIAAFALITSANAHMFLSSPVPMNGNAIKDPLDASGDNFPCHGVALGSTSGVVMNVGDSQNLTFDNGAGANWAVHGGGSCQISITYETDAVKVKDPANWAVLYSIEGGCPTNSPLNLNGAYTSAEGSYTGAWQCSDPKTNGYDCVNEFNFKIPAAVKNGQATLAWTWFNSVGNREMYMNCINVNIQGGASDTSGLAAMPPMFVANMASIDPTCKTSEQQNVGFPNPGTNVLKKLKSSNYPVASASDYPLVTPSGCSSGTYAVATAAATTAASATTAATTLIKTTAAATVAATTATGTAAAAATTVKTSNIQKAAAGTSTTSTAGSASTCAAGSVSCGAVNTFVCVDTYHFGICDYNGCAISQAVAPGTACVNGGITYASTHKHKKHVSRHAQGLFRKAL